MPKQNTKSEPARLATVSAIAEISHPQSWTPIFDHWGVTQVGWKLPDGRILKGWICFEVQDGDNYRDLTPSECLELGLESLDYIDQSVIEGASLE